MLIIINYYCYYKHRTVPCRTDWEQRSVDKEITGQMAAFLHITYCSALQKFPRKVVEKEVNDKQRNKGSSQLERVCVT